MNGASLVEIAGVLGHKTLQQDAADGEALRPSHRQPCEVCGDQDEPERLRGRTAGAEARAQAAARPRAAPAGEPDERSFIAVVIMMVIIMPVVP